MVRKWFPKLYVAGSVLTALALFVGMAMPAQAALTFGATSVTTDGNYTVNGVAASVYAFGAATTTGTITIGGTAQTGNMVLGSSSGISSVLIGNGAGASTVGIATTGTAGNTVNVAGAATADTKTDTVNIATGNTAGSGSKVVHIADGTPAATGTATVTIGGVTNASVTTLQGGTGAGAITLTTAAAGGIKIGSTTMTGSIVLGQSTDDNTIAIGNANIATGKTQTINVGAGTPAGTGKAVITIGNTANASSVVIKSGTGGTLLTSGTGITANGPLNYGADAGSTDDYVITLTPAPTAYVAGMVIVFTVNTANTTGATINVNGLGVKALVKGANAALATNDLIVNRTYIAVYDGTQFDVLNPAAQ